MQGSGLVVALLIAVVPAAVLAQTADDDARCLIVSSTFARTAKDPKAQQVAQAAAAFYLGRIDGRYPAATLRAAIAAQGKQLTPATAPGVMERCAMRVNDAQTRIQAAAASQPQPAAKKQPGR